MKIKSTPAIEKKIEELRNKGAFVHVMRAENDSNTIIQCDVFQMSWTSKMTLQEANAELWAVLTA